MCVCVCVCVCVCEAYCRMCAWILKLQETDLETAIRWQTAGGVVSRLSDALVFPLLSAYLMHADLTITPFLELAVS